MKETSKYLLLCLQSISVFRANGKTYASDAGDDSDDIDYNDVNDDEGYSHD